MSRCEGIFLCVEGEDMPQCSAQLPSAELCNFRDDDCDGTVDEGFEGREEACAIGVGACQRYGVLVCNEAPQPVEGEEMSGEEWSPLICNAAEGSPEVERCDGLDNDCDGVTDEDYPTLGEICTVGEGLCRQSSVTRCDPSGEGVICEVSAGLGELERCDGADNDCDGVVDEDYSELNEICVAGVGACERRGLNICAADGEVLVCSVVAGEVADEVCDNVDNDCDGVIDEEYPTLGEVCFAGEGVCRQSSVIRCDPNGEGVFCGAVASQGVDERCDGADNDCDGSVDEDFVGLNDLCTVGVGACERRGLNICAEDGANVSCSVIAGEPNDESCDNIDNDCDGSADEDYPSVGDICTSGVGQCRQSSVTRCAADGQGVSCEVNASLGELERCDGVDNDCDGVVDEDYSELNEICVAGIGACERRGLNICAADGETIVCSVIAGEVADEVCDTLDNDCDGAIDEVYPTLGEVCFAGEGVCRQSSVIRCDPNGEGVFCGAVASQGVDERCDGADNDCDGSVDEDFVGLNDLCTVGVGACERRGLNICAEDGANVSCSVIAGEPNDESCDNIDNDCDGSADEDYPSVGDICTSGVGQCRQSSVTRCAADGQGVSCEVNVSLGELERCDGVDNDCDGMTDEDYPELNELCVEGEGACERQGCLSLSPQPNLSHQLRSPLRIQQALRQHLSPKKRP